VTRITAEWIDAAASRAVMAAIGTGYFVGGCVRNALLGVPVTDIDIATPATPDQVTARLKTAGLKVVPTGFRHGTVTAVHEGKPIEVTTFRADVSTDGRRARVAFTTDMAIDAGRRDFTINALYAEADGRVLDPLGGLPDIMARRVRFIGDARDRIREDYLRILRFFRFHALHGAEGIDADGLAACAELADGLERIARERIGWEFRKLLAAPDPAPAVASMAAAGVLARCLPGAEPAALAPLVHAEATLGAAPDWQVRLAVLGGKALGAALRLSRREEQRLAAIDAALGDAEPGRAAYRHGAEAATAAVLIRAAAAGAPPPDDWRARIARGAHARFPLRAEDLAAAGWEPGPGLGAALARAETAWIDSGFEMDRADLVAAAGDRA